MDTRPIERRQQRRAEVEGRVELRGLEAGQVTGKPLIGRADNVSLAGVYAKVPAPFPWEPGTLLACSVNFPQETARQFPFSRLTGRGRVVRVFDAPGKRATDSQDDEVGVAISFTSDITALGTIGGY